MCKLINLFEQDDAVDKESVESISPHCFSGCKNTYQRASVTGEIKSTWQKKSKTERRKIE